MAIASPSSRRAAPFTRDLTCGSLASDVLVGRDGWLFLYGGAHNQMEVLTGKRPPQAGSVARFWDNIASRMTFCQEHRIQYVHLVSPSKPVIMTEFLPSNLQSQVQSLFYRHFQASTPPALQGKVVYPEPALKEANEKTLVFRKRDTHMSAFGNFTVAQALLAHLNLPEISHLDFAAEDRLRNSDLAKMLSDHTSTSELHYAPLAPQAVYDNKRELAGNTGHFRILRSPGSLTDLRALIFGDSFVAGLLHLLTPVFREVFYVRSAVFEPQLATAVQPDVVITGNTERYLKGVARDPVPVRQNAQGPRTTLNTSDPRIADALNAQMSAQSDPVVLAKWQTHCDTEIRRAVAAQLIPNNQLELVSDRDNGSVWKSSGTDPQLQVKLSRLGSLETNVSLKVHAKANSVFEAFLIPFDRDAHRRRRVLRCKLTAGWNDIAFPCAFNSRTHLLRIDPAQIRGPVMVDEFQMLDRSETSDGAAILRFEPLPT